MEEVFDWMLNHWAFCVFCITCVIQFTPAIKWNPLTAFFGWLGKQIVRDVTEKLKGLELKVDNIEVKVGTIEHSRMEDEKDRIRYEVLCFANSCRNGCNHTRDEFQHIMDLKDKYEHLLELTGDKNGVFDEEYHYIIDIYHEKLKDNSFLA